jgi:hypothetical protein
MKNRLIITILQADLAFEHYDFPLKELYLEASLDFKKYRSSVISSFKFKPVWNETLSFDIRDENELVFEMFHRNPELKVLIYLNSYAMVQLKLNI